VVVGILSPIIAFWLSYASAATKQATLVSPVYGVRYTIPASLYDEPNIGAWVDFRAEEFLLQCYKWQDADQCDRVPQQRRVIIVDDFVFRCPSPKGTGVCAGRWWQKKIKTVLYNRLRVQTAGECAGQPNVRSKEQMARFSRSGYWLTAGFDFYCADTDDILPALLHEFCHFAGATVGHTGLEDCQPVR